MIAKSGDVLSCNARTHPGRVQESLLGTQGKPGNLRGWVLTQRKEMYSVTVKMEDVLNVL